MNNTVPIIIPSLQPDENLILLIKDLKKNELGPIVVVDDGSGEKYKEIFQKCEDYGCILLRHAVNLGKGRALKNAFNFCLNEWKDMVGCITADSDGQHSVSCINKCRTALIENPNSLVLGVRDFSGEDVPFKSRYGNNITKWVCKTLCGVSVSDTQTGLRGIPTDFMKELMEISGERFEYETRMLIATKDKWNITEVVIETIYDSKENHATHFDPVKDSVRIYKIFAAPFVRFIFSSLSSCGLDLLLFTVFCSLIGKNVVGYITIATVLARVISAVYNYFINYKMVFHSKTNYVSSAFKYCIVAVIQMFCSAGLVTLFAALMPLAHAVWIKIPVDTMLFFVSFSVQREFVYRKRNK